MIGFDKPYVRRVCANLVIGSALIIVGIVSYAESFLVEQISEFVILAGVAFFIVGGLTAARKSSYVESAPLYPEIEGLLELHKQLVRKLEYLKLLPGTVADIHFPEEDVRGKGVVQEIMQITKGLGFERGYGTLYAIEVYERVADRSANTLITKLCVNMSGLTEASLPGVHYAPAEVLRLVIAKLTRLNTCQIVKRSTDFQ